MNKNLLHIISGLDIGGAEMMLYKLLKESTTSNFDPIVVSLRGSGPISARIERLGVPIYHLGIQPSSLPRLQSVAKLRSVVKKYQPIILHGWMYHGNMGALLAKIWGNYPPALLWNIRQTIETLSEEKWLTANLIRLGAKFSSHADCLVYNSSVSAIQHNDLGYSTKNQIIIPNGFDMRVFQCCEGSRSAFRDELKLDGSKKLVGYIARLHPKKDHSTFFGAAHLVANENPDVRFVLVGKGLDSNNGEILSLVKKLNLKEKVFLLGEREDIVQINCALDIAVSTSARGEGFSNVIGEAMACGVPCVVTDVGEASKIVGDTGKVVKPGNSKEFASAVTSMLSYSYEMRHKLGSRARDRIARLYSINKISQMYENLYESMVSNLSKNMVDSR